MENIEELKNANSDCSILKYYALRLSQIDNYYISEYSFYQECAVVYFIDNQFNMFVSIFVRDAYRGSGVYLKSYYAYGLGLPIITIEDCGLVQYLKKHDIPHIVVKTA